MTHTPWFSRAAGSVVTRAGAIKNVVLAGGMALVVAGGCGLISSDVTKVSFDLPAQSYRFDTAQADWMTSTATSLATVPSVGCTADADCCSPAVMALGINCSKMIICDATSLTCAFAVTVEAPRQEIDLQQSVPPSLSSQSVLDITVTQITYDVTENSMNVDLPKVELFIADKDALSTDDSSAVQFGTLPPIPKGMTSTGGKVTLTNDAAAAFIKIGHNLGTPFTFLARSRVVVPGGTPIPMGALGLTIKGRLAAQPNL